MIHLLTSRPGAAACVELLRAARALGVPLRAGAGTRFAPEDVVFAYGARRGLLAGLAGRVGHGGAGAGPLILNGVILGKHEQYERLRAAGIPVPRWLYAPAGETLTAARLLDLAASGGVAGREPASASASASTSAFTPAPAPVILKPDLGGFGAGVRLVADPARFEARALTRAHVAQEFMPCGGRCARVVVLGGAVAWTIDRVARDGVVAAYQHGRRGWLEPVALAPGEEALCVAAARALDIEIAGVDLIRTARGPFILEVNHRFVPYHLRAMYGDVPARIVAHLAALHAARAGAPADAPPARRFSAPPSRALPRAVRSWRRLPSAQPAAFARNQRVSNGRR